MQDTIILFFKSNSENSSKYNSYFFESCTFFISLFMYVLICELEDF